MEECAKEINLIERIFELPESSVGDLKKRSNKLMEDYKVKYFFISNEDKKDDDGKVYKGPNVTIIGNSEYIDELYNNEIKDYENYINNYDYGNYGEGYNNISNSNYRQNKRYNNNYYYHQNSGYKYNNKGYNSRKNYY